MAVAAKAKAPSGGTPLNNTVKLSRELRTRVDSAMEATGFSVWSEFCRIALLEKCHAAERHLRERDPAEYHRIYGKNPDKA